MYIFIFLPLKRNELYPLFKKIGKIYFCQRKLHELKIYRIICHTNRRAI
jgi:hypothetical protein